MKQIRLVVLCGVVVGFMVSCAGIPVSVVEERVATNVVTTWGLISDTFSNVHTGAVRTTNYAGVAYLFSSDGSYQYVFGQMLLQTGHYAFLPAEKFLVFTRNDEFVSFFTGQTNRWIEHLTNRCSLFTDTHMRITNTLVVQVYTMWENRATNFTNVSTMLYSSGDVNEVWLHRDLQRQ